MGQAVSPIQKESVLVLMWAYESVRKMMQGCRDVLPDESDVNHKRQVSFILILSVANYDAYASTVKTHIPKSA